MKVIECKNCRRVEPYPDGKFWIEECIKKHCSKFYRSKVIPLGTESYYMVYDDDPARN